VRSLIPVRSTVTSTKLASVTAAASQATCRLSDGSLSLPLPSVFFSTDSGRMTGTDKATPSDALPSVAVKVKLAFSPASASAGKATRAEPSASILTVDSLVASRAPSAFAVTLASPPLPV
jgi:hypothetical protein